METLAGLSTAWTQHRAPEQRRPQDLQETHHSGSHRQQRSNETRVSDLGGVGTCIGEGEIKGVGAGRKPADRMGYGDLFHIFSYGEERFSGGGSGPSWGGQLVPRKGPRPRSW